MPQVIDRPPVVIHPRSHRALQEPHRFTRWLGWLLAAVVVLGGAGLIWYGIANDAEPVAAGQAATIAEIDPYLNPELKQRINLTPASLEFIDLYENPELAGAEVVQQQLP
jgi:hypothetical protein